MRCVNGAIHWGPRLRKNDVRRLYESYMAGFGYDDLLDDVGTALYIRCGDILYLRDAREGGWRCLPCECHPAATGPGPRMEPAGAWDPEYPARKEPLFVCPKCGWRRSWEAMRSTFRRKQLHSGGAADAFAEFMDSWRGAAGQADAKMRAVDKVLHSFHYSLRSQPDLPTRAAGVNLIEGKLADVLAFLDGLSANRRDPAADRWRGERSRQA